MINTFSVPLQRIVMGAYIYHRTFQKISFLAFDSFVSADVYKVSFWHNLQPLRQSKPLPAAAEHYKPYTFLAQCEFFAPLQYYLTFPDGIILNSCLFPTGFLKIVLPDLSTTF